MIDFKTSINLKTNYQSAKPFPYIVIDNFLPEFVLRKSKEEIVNHDLWYSDEVEWTQEFQQNKFYYPNHNVDMNEFKSKLPITYMLIDYFNSEEFLSFLKNLTGINGLYRDPYLIGGGIHKIKTGGKLSVHFDYNEHPGLLIRRKLNLLIYLNENWKSEWGGNLELWSLDLKNKEVEIEPVFNRAVLFDIENAPHGHPIPLNTPPDVDRYSLALYFFTDELVPQENKRTVIFFRDDEIGKQQ